MISRALLLVALGLPALAVQADTFRVYVVSLKQAQADANLRPMELLNAVAREEAVLQAYAEVTATPAQPGRKATLADITYAESWDSAAKVVTKHASRAVGTSVDITFVKGDEIRLDFKDTRLDRWIVMDLEAGAMQPVFVTREASMKAVAPSGTVTLLAASQNDGTRVHYLVHRLPPAP